MSDYQKKRQMKGQSFLPEKSVLQQETKPQPPAFIKNVARPVAKVQKKDDDGWGDMEPDADGLDEFDYKNTDLNKCSEYELKKHKKKMDENFVQNQLKPGDPGYQYDKRVKFDYDHDELEQNSWDEDEEDEIDSDEYDRKTGKTANVKGSSKTALEIAMEKAMAAANLGDDYDDEDYFDDDFA